MKKMKKLVVICGLMVVIAWQSQNLIVETMRIVDFYGEKTNTNVVEIWRIWYILMSIPVKLCRKYILMSNPVKLNKKLAIKTFT